jgi:putative oxidoreductase
MMLVKLIRTYMPPLIRVCLGSIFLWSGVEKLGHLEEFYRAAHNYQVLPPVLTQFYATALPWMEVLCGTYLVLGLFGRFASAMTAGMLVSFLIAIAMVLVRGDATDCGCFFGGMKSQVSWDLFWRDVGLLAAAAYLYYKSPTPWSLDTLLHTDNPAAPTKHSG